MATPCLSGGKPVSRLARNHIHIETNHVRKHSTRMRIEREIQALEYVRSNTSIPIPEIVSKQILDDDSWILMSRMPGVTLEVGWTGMTDEARSATIGELKIYLQQLRRLRPPEKRKEFIGAIDGGAVYDHRLNNGFACGPFESVAQFNDFLSAPVRRCPKPELEIRFRSQLRDDADVLFAHADISSENVLVDPTTGKVTAILDWEMAGFWPEWWEFRKALAGSRNRGWWPEVVKKAIPVYFTEWAVDSDLECFG